MLNQYSEEFVRFYGIALLLLLALAIGYSARLIVTRGRDIDAINPVSLPLLVALGWATTGQAMWAPVGAGLIFGVSFVYGLTTGMLGFSVTRAVRDVVLSAASLVLVATMMAGRWGEGRAVFFLVAFSFMCAGLLFMLARFSFKNLPMVGMGALAMIEIIDFLVSPFGLGFWEYTSPASGVITTIGAVLLGLGAAVHPRLVIGLGVVAIAASELMWNLFIWLANENGELLTVAPDFTSWTTFGGVVLGFLLTLPFWKF